MSVQGNSRPVVADFPKVGRHRALLHARDDIVDIVATGLTTPELAGETYLQGIHVPVMVCPDFDAAFCAFQFQAACARVFSESSWEPSPWLTDWSPVSRLRRSQFAFSNKTLLCEELLTR